MIVGIDAGGTKTAALARTSGETIRVNAPGVQLLRDGVQVSAAALEVIIREAQVATRASDIGFVTIGLAGAGRETDRVAVESAVRALLGGAGVSVTNDAEIAVEAAFGEESGAVLLVGTGSLVYARGVEREVYRAGGWGALVGDDASGTSIGRAAVRGILAAIDGGPPTSMTETLDDLTGLSGADAIIHAVYTEHRPLSEFAPVALHAADAEDWVASAILAREANALAQQAGWVATRAGDSVEHRLAMCGGLTSEPVFRTALEAALGRHLPGWSITRCEKEPVEAALSMAQRMYSAPPATYASASNG